MAVSITVIPASGSITAKKDVCTFSIAGSEPNNSRGYDASAYPTQPENRFALVMSLNGVEVGRSQVFGTTPDGAFQFNSYIFPAAGTYSVQLVDVTDPDNETGLEAASLIVVA